MTDHPITPPPELVYQWVENAIGPDYEQVIATQAAQYGADQELLACGKYLEQCAAWEPEDVTELYDYRRPRPKPPSLKAGAIEVLDELDGLFELPAGHYNTILRALEQLDDSL